MSEIRDKVRWKMEKIIDKELNSEYPINIVNHIFEQVPELAIVDRDAQHYFPDMVFYCEDCDKMVKNTKCNIVDSGYVLEVKE